MTVCTACGVEGQVEGARCLAELAWWLVEQGRAAEAEPLWIAARETLQEVGPSRWQTVLGLDQRPVPARP